MVISVIVPAYNEEQYLPETLEYIGKALSLPACSSEIIVVDNDSQDATKRIAESFGAKVFLEKEHNIAKVRNTGAKNSNGDVLIFIDADTHVPETLFQKINAAMENEKCFGGAVAVKYEGFERKWMKYYLLGWKFWGTVFNMAQGAAQFCRKSVFERLEGYDQTIFMGEDVEFYWRLSKYARRNNGYLRFVEHPKVKTSSRRFDQMSLWKTFLLTHPIFIRLTWRKESYWKDWYEKAVRFRSASLLVLLFVCLGPSNVGLSQLAQSASPYSSPKSLPIPIVFGDGIISTGDDESHPAFTPDGRTLYFLKNTPDFSHWTIVVSRFERGRWSAPEVAPFSGQYSDADPFITPDGQRFFFISKRPVDGKRKEDNDIWMMEKKGAGWGAPQHLGAAINSEANEWFPTVADNGALYFGSERPGGRGSADIWRAPLTQGGYGAAENLGQPVNSRAGEFEPLIAPDESFLIFAAAGREGGMGAFDLYISWRKEGVWTQPLNLGEGINSSRWDFAPKLSPDGRYFFFASNRSFTDRPFDKRLNYTELISRLRNPRNGLRDIYQVEASALKLAR